MRALSGILRPVFNQLVQLGLPFTVTLKLQTRTIFEWLALSLAIHVTSRSPMGNRPCGGTHSTAGTSPELSVAMGSFQVTLAAELPWSVMTSMSLGHVFTSNDGGSASEISKTKYDKTYLTTSYLLIVWPVRFTVNQSCSDVPRL